MNLILVLLTLQGAMGAWDTVYHHEWRAKLPQQISAAQELRIHGIRSKLYAIVFAGLACAQWNGAWALVLGGIIGVEIVLTLWDFLVEDNSRKLPWSERVLHTVLAINGGAVFGLLAIELLAWWAQPTALVSVHYEGLSAVLGLFAIGVFASGVRDSLASARLYALARRPTPALDFGHAQRFLISGATGFVGQALVRALLQQGHSVTAWVRDPLAATHQLGTQVSLVSDLAQLGGISGVVGHAGQRAFDVVIDLAGESIAGGRWTAARKQRLIHSRVQTTSALVQWIASLPAAARPTQVLSASAVGYYGLQALHEPHAFTEADAPDASDFGATLCQAREQATRAFAALGVADVCLRLGVVLGHQRALPAMLRPFRWYVGGRIGSGAQVLSWIHLNDALAAIAHIVRHPHSGSSAYNLCAPTPITNADFARTAGNVLGRPARLPAPAWVFELVFGEMACLFTQGQRVIPARLQTEGFTFAFPNFGAALRDLET